MNKFLLLVILLISSCTNSKSNLQRRNLDEYFVGSGVVKYLLPEMPSWSNFSQTGQCRRNKSTRFLDYKNLRQSFALSYEEASHFQHMFNIENAKLLKTVKKAKFIPFKDEENLFYSISDKVQAGVRSFVVPKFNRVHLVWIDYALSDNKELKALKRLLNKSLMKKGHPVFVSLCLSQEEMEKFLIDQKMNNMNIRLIPFELFSPYDQEGELGINFSLFFDRLFRAEQQLHLFLPDTLLPSEFIGNFKIHKI